jgi:hypothetical protein
MFLLNVLEIEDGPHEILCKLQSSSMAKQVILWCLLFCSQCIAVVSTCNSMLYSTTF